MPAQLSTILYIAEYSEKTSSDFFVGTATGYTRLEGDAFQRFNVTVFYPTDENKPCYIPKLEPNQVLSTANSKFCIGVNNELDMILTSGTILNVPSDKLPAHQINVVGVAVASESACVTSLGIQIECVITDYISKDKPTETPITLFHPTGSRFTNQTSTVKRGSSIFFSGNLTSIESKLYLELHNFTFLRGHSSSFNSTAKHNMPWSSPSSLSSPSVSRVSAAQAIHNKYQQTHDSSKTTSTTPTTPTNSLERVTQTFNNESQQPYSPPITPLKNQIVADVKNSQQTVKRKTRSDLHQNQQTAPAPKRKTRSAKKLSDIASNVLATADPKYNSEDSQ